MSSPEIIFYQGLRCTKVLRQPRSTTTSTQSSFTTSKETSNSTTLSETSLPEPSTSSTKHPTVTTTTTVVTSTSTSDTSSSNPEHSQPSSSELSTGLPITVSPESSLTQTTLTTEPAIATSTATSPLYPLPDHSGSKDDGSPLSAILGSVFGGLGFIALVLVVCFFLWGFCRRRRDYRRRSAGTWSFGGSERLLRDGRASADSTTSLRREYPSGTMSYLSDAPVRSIFNFISGGNRNVDQNGYHDQFSPRQSNPFSDSAEVTHGPESAIVPIMIRHSLANPNYSYGGPSAEHPEMTQQAGAPVSFPFYYDIRRPESTHTSDNGSVHGSENSLGSTLILPGRSSTGSSVRRSSFPFPMPPNMGPTLPQGAATRDSTRSNPFDLDAPRYPASRQSSGSIPIALS